MVLNDPPRTLQHEPARTLELNAIGVVSIEVQRPLLFDPYRQNRFTGSFILIDPLTNETMGAGMILQAEAASAAAGRVTDAERRLAPTPQTLDQLEMRTPLLPHGVSAL